MSLSTKTPLRQVALLLLALVAAACGGDSGAGGAQAGDTLTLGFSSPAPDTEVAETFTVEFDTNVALGDPSTGNHHVHLCIDSQDCATESEYSLVYGSTFEVTGLTPGVHILGASLRNADHTDAGPRDEITVTVTGDGESNGEVTNGETPTDSTTSSGVDY